MNNKVVRIGGASAFWGDSSLAAPQLVQVPELNYLTFDFLAELTMSILSKAYAKDPKAGYAKDFVDVSMRNIIDDIVDKDIKVLCNAGGVNPRACAEALQKLAEEKGLKLNVAFVEGDNVMPDIASVRQQNICDLHSGSILPEKIMSANAYIGAWPIVKALQEGAQVVITGRCVDSALPLAALIHEFGWTEKDYDLLASGSLAGHLIECGPQATGGIFTDWEQVQGWDNIGYPVIECHSDGHFVVTKPENTGGLVTPATVTEQMIYEIGDPSAYLLPDVSCDFTNVTMLQEAPDRVCVKGTKGYAPSNDYKVSATYMGGWRSVVNITLIGGNAKLKAENIETAILARSRRLLEENGYADFQQVYSEILGTEAVFGEHSNIAMSREVILRLVVEHEERSALKYFANEIAPGAVSWAPGMTSIGGGRPSATPIFKLFSFMWPKSMLDISVTNNDATKLVNIETDSSNSKANVPSIFSTMKDISLENMVTVPLIKIAHGRSGDKGNSANIGIIARDSKWVPIIQQQLTTETVAEYFSHLVDGPVERFDLPGTNAFNFLLQDALGGGGMASPRSDPQGKAYAQMLLDIPIQISKTDYEQL